MQKTFFGRLYDGTDIYCYTLKNQYITAKILNYGAIIKELWIRERNTVLGYNTLAEYETDLYYLGAVIGRVAGRIQDGRLMVSGRMYQLEQNNGNNHLHGGNQGFHKKVWDVLEYSSEKIRLTYHSPHMEENYPGNVDIIVEYRLEGTTFILEYQAQSDRETVINLTNHSYFNLSSRHEDISQHFLQINAQQFYSLDGNYIPRELLFVDNTPFDFRKLHRIQEKLSRPHKQLELAGGYDHLFVLQEVEPQVILLSPDQNLMLCASTNQKYMIFYTGNFLGTNDTSFICRQGLCLEMQSVNQFGLISVKPDMPYYHITKWNFQSR